MDKLHETTRLTESMTAGIERIAAIERRVALLLYHRDGVESVPLLPGVPVVVGRTPPANVAVADPSLSRKHARFTLDGEDVTVEDLGSTNGTRIGGVRIEKAIIRPGDEVAIGSLTATIHVLTQAAADSRPQGIEGHDRFCAALEAEIVRARFFGRSAALLSVRPLDRDRAHVRHWASKVQSALRPVDRLALYSEDSLEVLLPESDAEHAAQIARAITSGDPPLACGVATFPQAAGSIDGLLEASRGASQRATLADRVHVVGADLPWTASVPSAEGAQPIADSPAMRSVLETATRLARGVIPVLLLGETGTGKEILARFIHERGPRADKPLVSVNCGAIPGQLVESTLFGHEKGAFTGAVSQQKGVFETASGGTVLLDEIGELPAPAQAALLRVLETKKITRVGAAREIEVNARIIAATHRDLETMVDEGRFRRDLLYRLNALTLRIPPLRSRPDDIPLLIQRFLRLANEANARAISGIDPDASDRLLEYTWPGNVRELRNAIERAVVIAQGETITLDDLPERIRGLALAEQPPSLSSPSAASGAQESNTQEDFRTRVDRFEAELLVSALRGADWNQSEAARRLRLPLRTLVYKMKVHGIKKLGYGAV